MTHVPPNGDVLHSLLTTLSAADAPIGRPFETLMTLEHELLAKALEGTLE